MRPPVGASLSILDALRDGPLSVTAVVRETRLSQSNVSNHLGRLRALGWVTGERAGRQVLYHITDYFVEQFVRSQERPATPLGVRGRRRIARELLPAMAKALTEGAEAEARQFVHEALLRGLAWSDLYLLVFTPALRQIGDAWQEGVLSVANEHLASAIIERLMARIHPGGTALPCAPSALVACVEGNFHALGARMAADFFVAAGWQVCYLGANTPTTDLVDAATEADVVGLSVSRAEQLPALREAAARLHARSMREAATHRIGGNGSDRAGDHHLPSEQSLRCSAERNGPFIVAGGGAMAGNDAAELGVDMVDRYLPLTVRRLERGLRRRSGPAHG
jgi:methanogenic corrinoid protein MtbC1